MQTTVASPRRSRTSTLSRSPLPVVSHPPVAAPRRPEPLAPELTDAEIARLAYARWENSDQSHGRDQEHWFAAEAELRRSLDRDAQDLEGDGNTPYR